jgi:Lipocalin-like domain
MKPLAAIPAIILLVSSALAGEPNPLVGTWRVTSLVTETTNHERYNQLGDRPTGYLSYSADGQMSIIIVAGDRPAPLGNVPTDAERLKLFETMIAYAGSYRVDGDKVIHHIDVAWNGERIGTDQVRFFTLSGNSLTLRTTPSPSPVDGREGVGILSLERVAPAPK